MELKDIEKVLSGNSYPGRGIVLGISEDGRHAVMGYFIMGRSENSRNRIFVEDGDGIRTQAFDPAKMEDPSLIIYAPVRVLGSCTIVTNGDQTDTIYEGLSSGKCFGASLRTRRFEPDDPNFTPRISGLVEVENGSCGFRLSILKSDNGDPSSCLRYMYEYESPAAGVGRLIHTYIGDGSPLPSFEGEPTAVRLRGGIDEFTDLLWTSLNDENKVSLFVRYIDIEDGSFETRMINKNK